MLLLFVTGSQAQIGAFNCTTMLNESLPCVGFLKEKKKGKLFTLTLHVFIQCPLTKFNYILSSCYVRNPQATP